MRYFAFIRHRIADFDTWKTAYRAHASARAMAGLKELRFLRDVDDPNQVTLFFAVDDMDVARKFCDSAELHDAMAGAGVMDKPTLYFLEEID